MTRTPIETLRADLRLAHEAMLMHASSVADSRAGVLRMTRYRARLSAPSKNYAADHTGEWNCAIPEDAPIWEPCREGTRTWRVGEEVDDVER